MAYLILTTTSLKGFYSHSFDANINNSVIFIAFFEQNMRYMYTERNVYASTTPQTGNNTQFDVRLYCNIVSIFIFEYLD